MSLQTFFDKFEFLADASNGGFKLRELILQLAVEGKLVPQNPRDEPADEAIKRAKKAELLLNVEPAEMLFALPVGWAWLKLADLGNWAIGSGFPTNEQGETDKPILFCKVSDMNLEGNEKWIVRTRSSIDEETARRIRAKAHPDNTVVFPKIGGAIATNKRRILTRPTAIDNNCLGIIPSEYCSSDWLYLLLSSIDFMPYQSGTSVPALSQGVIGEIVTALPPLKEQKRVVAKVEEMMRLCDELEARKQARRKSRARLTNVTLGPLNNAASLAPEEFEEACTRLADNFGTLYDSAETVGKLRSTILQLAVQGKLVPQDPTDEPANKLMDRFRDEREKLRKDNRVASVGTIAESFSMPLGWAHFKLGELIKFIGGSQPPKNKFIYQAADGYTRLIQIRDYKSDAFKTYVPNEHANRPATKDDVMIGRYGPPVFQILRGLEGTYNVALMKAAPIENVLTKDYLFYLLKEPKLQNLVIEESERTAGQSGVRKELLHNYVAGLPPLAEQKRIVAKVNQLMALCDELETKLRQAQADSEKLMNAAVQHVLDIASGKEKSQRKSALALSSI